MTQADHPPSLPTARALQVLAVRQLKHESVQSLLDTVADLARQVLPGDVEASVTRLDGHRPTTVAATGQLASTLDEAQYAAGQGPCLHAATTGELTEIADTRTDARWTHFRQRALDHGIRSSLSLPLAAWADGTGSLNVYARTSAAFDDRARTAATRLAAQAAVALANVRDYQAARADVERLETAFSTRTVVEQATGMLIERLDVAAPDAHRVLVDVAGRTGVPVQEVAAQLVATGDLADADAAAPGPVRWCAGRWAPGTPQAARVAVMPAPGRS